MAAPRVAAPPPLSCADKDSLPESSRREIDSVLKQLKTVSRRLQIALQVHRDELQVLERLYYKGKNQHRTALFWQRVAEMRNFGDRLQGADLYPLVESIRLSFWGDPSGRNPKVLKGRWTHIPDPVSLAFVLKRSSDCYNLVEETQKRLLESYRSFNVMMQTGAFIQLILTLVAINSRLNVLTAEISSALLLCQSVVHKALNVIDPKKASSLKHLVKAGVKPSLVQNRSHMPSRIESPAGFGEDLGSTVQRQEVPMAETELDLSLQESDITMDLGIKLEPNNAIAPVAVARTTVRRNLDTSSTLSERVAQQSTAKRKTNSTSKQEKPAKKKKKKDEIDDIFGF